MTFSNPSVVGSFRLCLRLSNTTSYDSLYPIRDFGYPDSKLQYIYPLGMFDLPFVTSVNPINLLKGLEILYISDESLFWCSDLKLSALPSKNNTIILFPISHYDNYESVSSSYVSSTTKGLMYTLGVLYCIIGFIFFLMLVSAYIRN